MTVASKTQAKRRGTVGALCLFVALSGALFWDVWAGGIDRTVPFSARQSDGVLIGAGMTSIQRGDSMMVAAVVAHNASTLARRPHRVFETLQCAPLDNGLALSEPMLTLGLLGVPARLVTASPVAVFNLAVLTLFVVTAFAMYLLVRDWTGSPIAALIAACLYAFDTSRLSDISHPFVYDTSWAVFCLYFARRLVLGGRWHDALGLAGAGALQLGTSLYPTLAALLVLVPFGPWLAWRHGLRRVRASQLALVVAVVALAGWFVFGPFLEIRGDILGTPESQTFARWSDFGPGGILSPAASAAALALLALLGASTRTGPDRPDPSLPLLVGLLLCGLVSVGPQQPWGIPDLYALLGAVLPGLDTVRAPIRVAAGVHLAACILAGIGAARVLSWLSARRHTAWRWGLMAVVLIDVFLIPMARMGAVARFGVLDIAPSPVLIAFYAELEDRGNVGPIVEVPNIFLVHEAERLLMAQYHGRRTSACYGSFLAEQYDMVKKLAAELPDPAAVRALRDLGFTTLVIRHLPQYQKSWQQWMLRVSGLPRIHSDRGMVAYSLEP